MSLNSGKKVCPQLNFQVNDKVRLINKLMNRVCSAFGTSEEEAQSNGHTVSLLNFLSVTKKPSDQHMLREKLLKILYAANESNRAYFMCP